MEPWQFDAPTQNPDVAAVQNYVTENLHSTKAGMNAARMLDLYNYLHSRTFSSAGQLRMSVLQDGVPVFSPAEASIVFNSLKMRGGADPVATIDFFDKMTKRLGSYTGELIPDSFQGIVYFLRDLEMDPEQGPIISTALDVATQFLPSAATTIQSVTPQVVGVLPIPSSGLVGTAIGWVLSAFILFLVIVMNVSRRKFGTAFVTALALIPIAGSSLLNAAKSFERVTARMSDRRERLISSVGATFGSEAALFAATFIPDLRDPDDYNQFTSNPPPTSNV